MTKRLFVLGGLVCALALLCACHRGGGPAPASADPSAQPTAPVYFAPVLEPSAAPSPSPAQPPDWAAAYIETVNALAQEAPELTYDLI